MVLWLNVMGKGDLGHPGSNKGQFWAKKVEICRFVYTARLMTAMVPNDRYYKIKHGNRSLWPRKNYLWPVRPSQQSDLESVVRAPKSRL